MRPRNDERDASEQAAQLSGALVKRAASGVSAGTHCLYDLAHAARGRIAAACVVALGTPLVLGLRNQVLSARSMWGCCEACASISWKAVGRGAWRNGVAVCAHASDEWCEPTRGVRVAIGCMSVRVRVALSAMTCSVCVVCVMTDVRECARVRCAPA